LLLSRYSGRDDIVFGVTRACRRSNDANTVGMLINTLPVRVRTPGDAVLLPWLKGIREQWLSTCEYENTPLDRVWRASGLPPAMPPFETVVVYEHEPVGEMLRGFGGKWDERSLHRVQRTDTALTCAAYGRPSLTLELIHDTRRFGHDTIARIGEHLQALLEGFPRSPDHKLRDLRMLSVREEQRLIRDLSQSTSSKAPDTLAHQLFERQVRRAPEKTALESARGLITYLDLNQRANRLARRLREKGAGPERIVALCQEASPECVIAILAVLKAGATFLPIAAECPPERLAVILGNARPVILLFAGGASPPPAGPETAVCSLEQLEREAENECSEDLPDIGDNGRAAYVIYTSGSTGTPKGVVMPHRALANHTFAAPAAYEISDTDRRLQFASVAADMFIAEIFNFLSRGATLVFGLQAKNSSIREFLDFVEERRLTVAGMPAAWWREWVATLHDVPGCLRAVIVGMERMDPADLTRWRERVGVRVRLFNAYGPTEAGPTSTIYEAGTSEWESGSYVPIGRPIANTRVYVLDGDRHPVPVGVAGELYIGGEGLARGYLNAPQLTTERFVADPFSSADLLYRTGDIGFYSPDGNLAFVGRKDRQVKIRGFRVELDEIEAVLGRHSSVRRCSVVPGEDAGSAELTAYVEPQRAVPSAADLHHHLARHLPAQMIPNGFVIVDALPLTSTGKIDREQLLGRAHNGVRQAGNSGACWTGLEKRLAALWREVLGVSNVGLSDNFFEAGGESLRATRLIARIAEEFKTDVPLAAFLRSPTVAQLASQLEHGSFMDDSTPELGEQVIPLRRGGSRTPLFCISSTVDDAYCYRHVVKYMSVDRPVFVVRNQMRDGEKLPSIEELADRVCDAVSSTTVDVPCILAGYCFGGILAFEAGRLLRSRGQDVRRVVLFDTPAPGYPRLLRSYRRYWRQMREIARAGNGQGLEPRDIKTHMGWMSRRLGRKAQAQVKQMLPRAGLNSFAAPAADLAARNELCVRMFKAKPAAVPVVQFLARDEKVSARILEDARLSWRDLCGGDFEVHTVEGDHETLFLEPYAKGLAAALDRVLQRAGT
jgi:amino acid adenylation domain-containing protein